MNDDWTKKHRENNDCNLLEGNIKWDELDIKKFQKLVLHTYNVKNISFHNESLKVFGHKSLVRGVHLKKKKKSGHFKWRNGSCTGWLIILH